MVLHGVGVNWGVNSTIIGVNGLFQSREHSFKADSELIRDGGNTTVSKVYYDLKELASFTYVAFQPFRTIFGDANVQIPTLGQFIQIIDARYPRIAGFWLVDDISVVSSNTTAARVTLALSRYPFLQRV